MYQYALFGNEKYIMGRGIASRHRTDLSPVGGDSSALGTSILARAQPPVLFFDKSTTALKFTLKLSDVFVIC